MTSRKLIKKEKQANLKRREHTKDYIELYPKAHGCEPNDADEQTRLNFQCRLVSQEQDSVDAKVRGSSFVLSTEAAINANGIIVGDTLKWSTIHSTCTKPDSLSPVEVEVKEEM